ncbi:hypothetical protein [Bilophila wadsworthia]|uniref:hypothetical protein n=1 Tax=Bilophila wadsworthia TaxID=35833 RepID=UPI00241D1733|nr:hypothetical protein [Bilophila wadsworthia]
MLKTSLAAFALMLVLAVTAAAAETQAPAWLIEAIARQESSLNPLAVNVAGKDYHPAGGRGYHCRRPGQRQEL